MRTAILATAEAAGWPRVSIGTLTLEGETSWRKALGRWPSPGEAKILLEGLGAPWVTEDLLATPAARGRLKRWFEAGGITPTPDDLVRRLRYLGDGELRSIVLMALHEHVPPPVVAFLLDHGLFVGVGWSARGWCCRVALPTEPVAVIMVSGASRDWRAILDTCLHENAHAWLIPAPQTPLRTEAVFNESAFALLAAAADPDLMRDVLRDEARVERQADALARQWGGRLSGTAERDNAHTRAEAGRLLATYGTTP